MDEHFEGSANDLHERIEEIEATIEELAEIAVSCRKWILLSKLGAAAGALALVAIGLGFVRAELPATVFAIAALVGGIVWGGSNHGTLRRTTEAIAQAEALRSRMIDAAGLAASASVPKLHG